MHRDCLQGLEAGAPSLPLPRSTRREAPLHGSSSISSCRPRPSLRRGRPSSEWPWMSSECRIRRPSPSLHPPRAPCRHRRAESLPVAQPGTVNMRLSRVGVGGRGGPRPPRCCSGGWHHGGGRGRWLLTVALSKRQMEPFDSL